VSGSWYGVGGGTNKEGQIGALIINVGPCRPIVSLNGANPIGVQINTPFVDPGATAFETCGGPVTLSTNGTVDITHVGSYTLTYTAISTADNATNTVTRTVNVWNNDVLNLDPAKSGDGISTPAGFNRLNWASSNPLTFSVVSANGSTYTVGYTNISGTYNTTKYNTIDQDGFYVNSGVTAGFYLTGMMPGNVVTLYACWAWDGAGNPGVVTFGGSTQTLNVGTGITSPSPATFMQIGSAVVDGTGTARGTWTGLTGKQGQIGGMIFTVSPPGSFSVSPPGVTNNCGGSATFTATPALGATNYQWYSPSILPILGATNLTLSLTNTHPSDSGTYLIVATGPTWASTNSVVLLTTDTTPPLVTLNGNSTNVIPLGSAYTELGAIAYDTCPGTSLPVTISGTVNAGVVGEYDITYSATTGAGTPGSLKRVVFVVDPTLKNLVITPPTAIPQCGVNVTFTASVSGFPPITYQWYDNINNLIPGATNASYTLVAPTDSNVGNYTVIAQNDYSSATNSATVASVLHTAPPVMALNGINPVTVTLNAPYADAGATAYDLCAQASLAVSSNNPVNTSVQGSYTVTYNATTADGTPGTLTRTVIVSSTPDFGPSVIIFDPSMNNIQSQLNAVFSQMQNDQFGPERYALLFKPGLYNNLDINVGFYTQVLGLGLMPDDVSITGYLHSDAVLPNGNATQNFWRSAENFDMVPNNSGTYIKWAVSQGTALRRMHVQGTAYLADFADQNWASGGFMSDSKVDGTMSSISQQQWLNRNDILGSWSGGVWNMVFVGVSNPPAGTWPGSVYTTVTNTPLIAEKPYLYLDTNGNYAVMVPAVQSNSFGTTWANGPTPGVSLPIGQFYVAHPGTDTAASMNAALNAGLNLILTPGVYQLNGSLLVTRPDTVVLGLGFPTLIPQTGTPALTVSDVNGVRVAGLMFDAGPVQSPTLLQVGSGASSIRHATDPIFLYDVFMRVGGATAGSTLSCVQIDANDVVGDNFWLWRADHGNGVGWTQNPCNYGLVVNGNWVTMYGLAVEHTEQYETLWNGNWGRVYFYQSELPYDPPSQDVWSEAPGVPGYASYKVADQVTSHQAYGIGIYAVFINCYNISCFNAIETPTNAPQVNVHHMINVYIAGNTTGGGISALYHIINGTGTSLYGPGFGGTATANYLWLNPTFNVMAAAVGSGAGITFPTESWHSYQLQYKNNLTDPSWLNLGSPVGGNDVQQTFIDSTAGTNRFYRVGY
jgi:hypothetical protein